MQIELSLFGTSTTMIDDEFKDDDELDEFNVGDLVCYTGFEGIESWPMDLGIVVRKSKSHYFKKVYIIYWVSDGRTTAALSNYLRLVGDEKQEED